MLRQGANSAVRFSSYSTLKQLAQGSAVPGEDMPGWMTFGIGATAGVITVCKSQIQWKRAEANEWAGEVNAHDWIWIWNRLYHALRVSPKFYSFSIFPLPLPLLSPPIKTHKADYQHDEITSVVKTRMQSIHAKQEYRNAFHCAFRIFKEEGVFKFWKGTVPRLGRLVVSTFFWFLFFREKTKRQGEKKRKERGIRRRWRVMLNRWAVVSSSPCTKRRTRL